MEHNKPLDKASVPGRELKERGKIGKRLEKETVKLRDPERRPPAG